MFLPLKLVFYGWALGEWPDVHFYYLTLQHVEK